MEKPITAAIEAKIFDSNPESTLWNSLKKICKSPSSAAPGQIVAHCQAIHLAGRQPAMRPSLHALVKTSSGIEEVTERQLLIDNDFDRPTLMNWGLASDAVELERDASATLLIHNHLRAINGRVWCLNTPHGLLTISQLGPAAIQAKTGPIFQSQRGTNLLVRAIMRRPRNAHETIEMEIHRQELQTLWKLYARLHFPTVKKICDIPIRICEAP